MATMYENGKIYRLICDDGHYYFGSTTNKLKYRLHNHKLDSQNEAKQCRLYDHIATIGWDKVKIEIVEHFACASKNELIERQQYHISQAEDDFMCLNHDFTLYELESNKEPESESDTESDYDETEYDVGTDDKYQYGKIYKLKCKGGHYYIGSTIRTLSDRLYSHKQCAKKDISKVYTHLRSIGTDNVTIALVESYPCSSAKQLRKREDEYIQDALHDPFCLNDHRAYMTADETAQQQKEYYKENRSDLLAYQQAYKAEHYKEILTKKAEYRKQHREELCEKQKAYAAAHKEQVQAKNKIYKERNKERIRKQCKQYNETHKEQVAAYKLDWQRKKAAEVASKTEKERNEKKEAQMKKTAERKRVEREIHTCECGGTYQFYQKNRHFASKKHLTFINQTVL